MIRCSMILILLILACASGLIGQVNVVGVEGADPAWLSSWESQIDKQMELLSEAFSLDEDSKESLRRELFVRLALQKEYEEKMNAELLELGKKAESSGTSDPDSPEVQALHSRFVELGTRMPLHEVEVAKWMETRVPPETAVEGRKRFEELINRRDQLNNTMAIDKDQLASRKAELAEASAKMRARPEIESQDPLPYGRPGTEILRRQEEAPSQNYVQPSVGDDVAAVKPIAPPVTPPSTPAAPPPAAAVPAPKPAATPMPKPEKLAPAPPLDDWDKHLASIADKYGFNDAQLTNARSILSDLRRRAYQYQASRAEEYARAKLMQDAKARSEEESRLNRPLDALFEELKQRLENLPTLEQRNRAAAGTGKKK